MRDFLKYLYKKNKRDFDVWNYLWLFSDNNRISFTHSELCDEFKLPSSSLHRILNRNIEEINSDEKVLIDYERTSYKNYQIIFYPKGKKENQKTEFTIYDEIYLWLKEYYDSIGFDYEDISKHKKYIVTICTKMRKVMKVKDNIVTDETLRDTFYFFVLNIDDWWKETGNITLPLLSKHFTKILNQIKSNGTRTKSDSYSKSAKQVDSIDFDKLTRK